MLAATFTTGIGIVPVLMSCALSCHGSRHSWLMLGPADVNRVPVSVPALLYAQQAPVHTPPALRVSTSPVCQESYE